MARKHLKPGALTAPLPPVLVTVGEGEDRNIITIGWTGILATHPARTYISVRPQRHSHTLLRRHGEFVINLATVDMAKKVDYCGIYTGKKVNKFAECGFTPVESAEVTVPSIAECPLSIECRVVEVIPMGTHDVFIADIVGVSCDDSILDSEGRLCFESANLLAYAHGEYFALGEKVGKFGFSTDKKGGVKGAQNPSNPTAKKSDIPASKKLQNAKISNSVPAKKPQNVKNSDNTIAKRSQNTKNATNSKNTESNAPIKDKLHQNSEKPDGHRPFYLDAPRGKNNRSSSQKKGGKKPKGGKK